MVAVKGTNYCVSAGRAVALLVQVCGWITFQVWRGPKGCWVVTAEQAALVWFRVAG